MELAKKYIKKKSYSSYLKEQNFEKYIFEKIVFKKKSIELSN